MIVYQIAVLLLPVALYGSLASALSYGNFGLFLAARGDRSVVLQQQCVVHVGLRLQQAISQSYFASCSLCSWFKVRVTIRCSRARGAPSLHTIYHFFCLRQTSPISDVTSRVLIMYVCVCSFRRLFNKTEVSKTPKNNHNYISSSQWCAALGNFCMSDNMLLLFYYRA